MAQSKGRLTVLTEEPYNAETVPTQHVGVITPISAFYKRNHFAIPDINPALWTLTVDGQVERPVSLSYEAILAMPRRTLICTMECAGNARCGFSPPAQGEQWQYGAVSTAEWTGTPLAGILSTVGVGQDVQEIVFEGSDRGEVAGRTGPIAFDRSLPLSQALHPDTLLVHTMNGELLPREHGAPVRLVVPGWYGMASVKWLERITASTASFKGFFQWDRYMMVDPADHRRREPLRAIRIRSIFTSVADGATLVTGQHHVQGLVWSGEAPIEGVEMSVDGGESWQPAWFTAAAQPYSWRPWETTWNAQRAGPYTLQCRATDVNGTMQPMEAQWNALGYANNAIESLHVTVVEA